MSAPTAVADSELRARIVPPAQRQAAVAPQDLLHSGNAGVVVAKVGQARSEYRTEARVFARELAKHVNTRQAGNASAFVYEESFGTEDRLHWLIHLRSLDSYYSMIEMGDQDRAYRASLQAERVPAEPSGGGKGAWDRLFADGSLHSTVLLPGDADQPGLVDGAVLHSANAGIVVHRSARSGRGARAEARLSARELVATVNARLAGRASAIWYEEAFGATDRLHWLLHLTDLTVYRRLLVELDEWQNDANRLFVAATMVDLALTPHHWGLYGTGEA